MKVSKAQAQAHREQIVAVAGSLFRERGFDGIGLNDLMAAAGLTRGAFYGHFESKQDLMVAANRNVVDGTAARWRDAIRAGRVDGLAGLARAYLSDAHRDDPAQGCLLAALSGDAARQPDAVRRTFDAGVEALADVVAPLLELPASAGHAARRERALATIATLVGALALSRAVADPALSRELRRAARHAVTG